MVSGPKSDNDEATTAAAEASEAAALKKLRQRLTAVYSRQADFYTEEQRRLLGDPQSRALDKVLPELRSAFQAYADRRTPLVIKLINLSGFPDSNPKSQPPPPRLSPLEKKFWLSANEIRAQIQSLDDGYSKEAAGILAQVQHMANLEQLALLQKIDAFRKQMNDRAIAEAVNPLEGGVRAQILHVSSEPAVVLPPLAERTMTLPAVPALPAPPKVDWNEAQPSPKEGRMLMERQLSIWLALNHMALASGPGRDIPDKTREFEFWRTQQQAGP
jgi:hypothetical protein